MPVRRVMCLSVMVCAGPRVSRAEHAEAGAEQLRARVEELGEQVAVLSRMLFGRSSEKIGPSPAASGGPGDQPAPGGGQPGKRGQRRVSKGHGRRDYSHLDTREEVHDVPEGGRPVLGAGRRSSLWGPTTASRSTGG
ncbi:MULTISPECIES: transposase [unclassified Frankia]|uniref:transposase n=2 Tax=Frankia TaxID=1854 RepID=UPI001EF6642C|nr:MULTISPECIES: transposase [unclassified Frankia]